MFDRILIPEYNFNRNDLPSIKEGDISGYFEYRIACDRLSTNDTQAIKKGQVLFESDRVQACSFVRVAEDVFFSGIVRAMMKRKV